MAFHRWQLGLCNYDFVHKTQSNAGPRAEDRDARPGHPQIVIESRLLPYRRFHAMKDWIRRNTTVIGAITGTVTLATTIVGSLLYFVVTKPMNQRFDAVEQRFQRSVTSALTQWNNALTRRDQRFDAVDQRFDAVDQRFDAVDQRFDAVDQRFKAVDQRFDDLDQRMEQGFAHAKEAREQDFAHLSQRFDAQGPAH